MLAPPSSPQGIIGMPSFYLIFTVLNVFSGLPHAMNRAGFFMGIFSWSSFSPSQIGRSVSLSQMQGSALQIIHRNHESLFWVQWARCCFFPNAFGGAYLCVMTLYAQMFFFHVRDVRVWDHHRCVCVVFVYHSQTDICSKGIRFRFMFPDLPSVPVLYSLPTVDSSSRSPRSASPAHYHCTATSTNPPSSPSSRSAGYLSPTCIPNPKRRSI